MIVTESIVINLTVIIVAAGLSETSAHSTRYPSPKDSHIQMDTYLMRFVLFTSSAEIGVFVQKQLAVLVLTAQVVECVWNVMAHAQKPDFVFRRKGRVHLKRRGRQFSRLLAAEVCASALVMLDTPCSEVVWRVLATQSIRQFPLHFPSRALPCAITFQLDSAIPRRKLRWAWYGKCAECQLEGLVKRHNCRILLCDGSLVLGRRSDGDERFR
jgi:hypothetical protein